MKYLDYDGLQRYDSKLKTFIEYHIPTKSNGLVDARNNNNTIKFALCTQAEYDELGNNYEQNVVYIITDDETSLYTVVANPQGRDDNLYTITIGTTDYVIADARVDDILNGIHINNFADVESALSDKQDTLSGSTSIDFTSNVVSVKQSYIDNQLLTDAEMATLISEVFD